MTATAKSDTEWHFTPEYDGSLSLEAAVLQAIGGGSMCWENPAGAGVFNVERAKLIAGMLVEFIESAEPTEAG